MRLTEAQETAAAAVEDQWLATGLQTGPANRPAAEEGVALAYRAAGLEPPRRIIWLGSPRAGAIAAAPLSGAVAAAQRSSAAAAAQPSGAVAADQRSGAVAAGGLAGDVAAADLAGAPRGAGLPDWFTLQDQDLTLGPSVRGQVRTAPWSAARAEALDRFGAQGWAQLSAAAGRRSWTLVMDRVAARLRARLREDLAELPPEFGVPAARAVLDAVYGQHDAAWLATFAAAEVLTSPFGNLAGLSAVARETGWWWPFANVAILTERPVTLSRDNVGRLHSETAALEYPDGYHLWAWRGMPIPPSLASELSTLTVDRIKAEPNAELRRVMLEHYGYDRYLREAGAQKRHTDETGTLWYLPLTNDEPLAMVEVVNATPEPDGTSRIYWLRVPPTTRTAREGVAWTFSLTADEYHPQIQT